MVAEGNKMESKGQYEFQIGMIIERVIEETWFAGKIINYDKRNLECTVRYLDDDQVEANIPIDEIRFSSQDYDESQFRAEKKDTLPKPLLGLVEDDSAQRSIHQPVVVIHNDYDTGS